MKSKGHILILLMVILWMGGAFLLFALDWARVDLWGHRLQVMSNHVLLSSLRVRAQGLVRMAERWEKDVQLYVMSYEADHAKTLSQNWDALKMKSKKLKRALSGYRGRIKGVRTVLLKAYHIPSLTLVEGESQALELGIEAKEIVVEDENGVRDVVEGLWIQQQSNTTEKADISVSRPIKGLRRELSVGRAAQGHLTWDAHRGFPREWSETGPFEWTYFKSNLGNAEKEKN